MMLSESGLIVKAPPFVPYEFSQWSLGGDFHPQVALLMVLQMQSFKEMDFGHSGRPNGDGVDFSCIL